MKVGKLRKLYSLNGTVELLEYIGENPGCSKETLTFVSSQILSLRLAAFREYGLICKEELRLTKLGRKYVSLIQQMEALEPR
jgi:hypothetical protein